MALSGETSPTVAADNLTHLDFSLMSYDDQLAAKITHCKQLFESFEPTEIEVFKSPEQHYRLRAEFRVWHEGDDLFYVMFNPSTKQKYRVDKFPVASELINQAMPLLLEFVKTEPLLKHKLFQVDFLSTLSNELLISMLYHKSLDAQWTEKARVLKAQFEDKGITLDVIGRAHKTKIVLDRDFVLEKLKVKDKTYIYKQVENSFTQPNGQVAQKMLEWAVDCTKASQGDLLELYCGNGNFSLALAQNFDKVLATELAKPSVQAAQYNIAANESYNVKILRMSAEEFSEAVLGKRTFRRLAEAQVELSDYQCETVFVDPPRSGLDLQTCEMIKQYKDIMYISCNLQTLKDNLQELLKTHKIVRMALFDQFPFTHHIESGVYLTKR